MRSRKIKKTFETFKNYRLFFAGGAILVLGLLILGSTYGGNLVWRYLHFPELALFLNPDASLSLNMGNYYFNVYGDGVYDLGKAEKYFRRALELDPRVPDAWHQLSRIDFLRGNFDGALEKINKQIELHGGSLMSSYYIRGLINGYAGNLEAAARDFKKFLEWDTSNWAAHNDLAWIYFRMGEYKKVEAVARAGLEYNPQNPWLLTSLGVSLLNQNNKNEARNMLEAAKLQAARLTEADWQKSYPGNDPRWASRGLSEMRKIIDSNLELAEG